MSGNHRWLRAGLFIMLLGGLGACSERLPDAPEPLDLVQPIDIALSDQAVRFEFETDTRNFYPGRPYGLELEVQRQGADPQGEPNMRALELPVALSLQQWVVDKWQDVATSDSYQARARNLGEPMPEWHTSSAWRYARLSSGSGGEYQWFVISLPLKMDTRYRLDVRTVQPTPVLKDFSARLRVRADPLSGK